MIKRTIVIESEAQLARRLNQLCVKRRDEMGQVIESTVPIEDIAFLVLESAHTTITNALLSFLVSEGVTVVTCDDKHMPVGMMLPLEGHTLHSARFQVQLETSQPLRKQMWAQLIKRKIINQGVVLQFAGQDSTPLVHWAGEVRSGDPDNLEARAAAYYWPRIFKDMEFRRDRFGLMPNPLLNYGYAILRAIVARALVSSGLLPALGVHHRNQYNAYCLADDVMEPYRPFVDQYILVLAEEMDYPVELDREWRIELLKIPTLDVWINREKSPLMVAVSRTTSSMVKVMEGEERRLVLPRFEADVI